MSGVEGKNKAIKTPRSWLCNGICYLLCSVASSSLTNGLGAHECNPKPAFQAQKLLWTSKSTYDRVNVGQRSTKIRQAPHVDQF